MDDSADGATDALVDDLWNPDVSVDAFGTDASRAYRATVLEQYKSYVETADRVSARRGLTNTFYLSINTVIVTVVGILWRDRPSLETWWLVLPALVAILQCVVWWMTLLSYRQLNVAKFDVIKLLEERLPAAPLTGAEWTRLTLNTDWRRYMPLTWVEQLVPALFAVIYLVGLVLGVLA